MGTELVSVASEAAKIDLLAALANPSHLIILSNREGGFLLVVREDDLDTQLG